MLVCSILFRLRYSENPSHDKLATSRGWRVRWAASRNSTALEKTGRSTSSGCSNFFDANGIDGAEKKRAVFLSVIGAATYKTLRNLLSPIKPGEKSYLELVDVMTKHFKPTPSEIVERFKFHSRTRRPGESVGVFVAELRSLAEFCNFRDTLEVMLRDRIVCGINDDAIQKRLLAEPALNYEKAVEMAMNMETAAQSMKELKGRADSSTTHTPPHHQVHRTSATPVSSTSSQVESGPSTCYRCGFRGHTVSQCRADKNVVCHQCGKKGHMRRACRSRQKTQQSSQQSAGMGNFRTVRQLEEDEEESDSQSLSGSPLCHVKSSAVHHSPPIRVKVKLDECLVGMEVDTGAAVSIMSEAIFRELWPTRELLPSQIRLQAYSKAPIPGILHC